jgi:hypothetical protein
MMIAKENKVWAAIRRNLAKAELASSRRCDLGFLFELRFDN